MSWQGSETAANRFFGSLAYLLPVVEVLSFGVFIFQQFPFVALLYVPLTPLIWIYTAIAGVRAGGFGVGSFIFFMILYVGVVTNRGIARFIRFNTLQAILIGILISLCSLSLEIFLPLIGIGSLTHQIFYNLIFLGTIAMCGYGIATSALGKYTEIPKLSETAQLHIDRY
jgi:Chloroplast import apparatus Tic20-like